MKVRTILVVDADSSVHEQIASVAPREEWRLDSAFDPSAGLACAKAEPYDVIFLAIHTPDGSGVDSLRRFQSICPRARIIVMAAKPSASDVIAAMRDGAFEYLSKPLAPRGLADLLALAAAGHSWEDDIRVLSATSAWVKMLVRCKMTVVDRLVQFSREREVDLATHDRDDIAAAFRELLLNAIEHGGRTHPDKRIIVCWLRTSRAVIYYLEDPGAGFSFDNLPHAAVSNPPDCPVRHAEIRNEQGVRPGGFGILLARRLVDDLLYSEKGNEALFVKYLKRP